MDNDIPEIKELIQQFSKLQGLGPKPGNFENCWINSFISGISLSIKKGV